VLPAQPIRSLITHHLLSLQETLPQAPLAVNPWLALAVVGRSWCAATEKRAVTRQTKAQNRRKVDDAKTRGAEYTKYQAQEDRSAKRT
jgi:hypothetical protein